MKKDPLSNCGGEIRKCWQPLSRKKAHSGQNHYLLTPGDVGQRLPIGLLRPSAAAYAPRAPTGLEADTAPRQTGPHQPNRNAVETSQLGVVSPNHLAESSRSQYLQCSSSAHHPTQPFKAPLPTPFCPLRSSTTMHPHPTPCNCTPEGEIYPWSDMIAAKPIHRVSILSY